MKKLNKLAISLLFALSLITLNSCTKEDISSTPTATTGDATFWVASDLGVGTINVTCNGITQVISGFYSTGSLSCGASGCANFNLTPGTYPYNASGGNLTWSGSITITAGGCSKQQLTGNGAGTGGGGGTGSGTGQATFWVASDLGVGNITVTCNNATQTITGFSSTGVPSCGASGCANFNLNPGTYTFSASGGSLTWNGTITVTSGVCSKQQFTNTGGGTGGGGTGTGQTTFWVATDLGVGNITVTCNNTTQTITGFSSTGTPSCGASSCANFTLNPGTYSYSARGGTLTWSGTITVTSGSCSKQQLTNTGGGGTGGGGTGSNCNWNSAVSCVTVTLVESGTHCGDPQSRSITFKNNCSQNIKTYICMQKTDGTWYGETDGTFGTGLVPGEISNHWICKGTGLYKIYAMPISDYNSNSCPWPTCN